MRLIDNWKQAWRYHTVILAAALGALNFMVAHSDALAAVVPPDVMSAINRWAPLLLIVLRLIKQPAVTNEPASPAPVGVSS